MVLSLQEKKAVITTVSKVNEGALSAVVADPYNIPTNKINELRKKGRELGVYIYIVRNTLLRRIVRNTSFNCLKDSFFGPTLIAYSLEHPGSGARLLRDFSESNTAFKVKAIAFEGELIPVSNIDRLATLPTYEEALSLLVSTMKEASAGKLVRTLAALRNVKANA